MAEIREVCSGLEFPEGPIWMSDGSILLVEIKRGTLTRVLPDGTRKIVAETGGGPNGAAIGPDGKVYVCNNGGFEWSERNGLLLPGHQARDYRGGSIQRVDPASGKVETLYTRAGEVALRGPNDLVFDSSGGFWFTDHGKTRERERDRTGVFYARPEGSHVEEMIFPLEGPNGIGLSPDQRRLYVAETQSGRVFYWDLDGPGRIRPYAASPNSGHLLIGLPGLQLLDSLAVDAEGNVCVATIANGGITIISPDGSKVEHVPMPDPLTTNLCFGGTGLRTAFVTLSGTGRLVSLAWRTPGLRLAYQA